MSGCITLVKANNCQNKIKRGESLVSKVIKTTLFAAALFSPTPFIIARAQTSLTHGRDKQFKPFCDGFNLIEGNSQTANWILLGEDHREREKTVRCLEKITSRKENHVILLEGYIANIEVPCSHHKITEKKGRICIGWDSLEGVKQAILINNMPAYIKIFKSFKAGFESFNEKNINNYNKAEIDKKYDFIYSTLNSNVQEELKYRVKQQSIPNKLSTLKYPKNFLEMDKINLLLLYTLFTEEMRESRKKGSSYQEIFKRGSRIKSVFNDKSIFTEKQDPKKFALVEKTLLARNKSLLNTLKGHKEAIVISGAHHVHDDFNTTPLDYTKYLRSELHKGKDQNPYAILAMPTEKNQQNHDEL